MRLKKIFGNTLPNLLTSRDNFFPLQWGQCLCYSRALVPATRFFLTTQLQENNPKLRDSLVSHPRDGGFFLPLTNTPSEIVMCRPDHFQVAYSINPWMSPGSVDQEKAKAQWENLLLVIKGLGVKIHVLTPDPKLPDMVFTRDLGIVSDGKLFFSRFAHGQRRGESQHFRTWCREQLLPVKNLPEIAIEGGDCRQTASRIFVGTGFRSSQKAAGKLGTNVTKDVVTLRLVHPLFYHLDTCFFPLNEQVAFYYPPAFSAESRSELQSRFTTLIELTKKEALNFCANSLVVGNTVLVQQGNPKFCEELASLGYKFIELDLGEFNKAGGGIHCLTFEI